MLSEKKGHKQMSLSPCTHAGQGCIPTAHAFGQLVTKQENKGSAAYCPQRSVWIPVQSFGILVNVLYYFPVVVLTTWWLETAQMYSLMGLK